MRPPLPPSLFGEMGGCILYFVPVRPPEPLTEVFLCSFVLVVWDFKSLRI